MALMELWERSSINKLDRASKSGIVSILLDLKLADLRFTSLVMSADIVVRLQMNNISTKSPRNTGITKEMRCSCRNLHAELSVNKWSTKSVIVRMFK